MKREPYLNEIAAQLASRGSPETYCPRSELRRRAMHRAAVPRARFSGSWPTEPASGGERSGRRRSRSVLFSNVSLPVGGRMHEYYIGKGKYAMAAPSVTLAATFRSYVDAIDRGKRRCATNFAER